MRLVQVALIELLLLFGASASAVDAQATPMLVYPLMRAGDVAVR